MRVVFLLIPVLLGACGEPSTAGGSIETTNGLVQIQAKDEKGQVLSAQISSISALEWLGQEQGQTYVIRESLTLAKPLELRQVLILRKDSLAAQWTWIPNAQMQNRTLILKPTLIVQGIAPVEYDSVALLGTDLRSAVSKNSGRYEIVGVPVGRGMLLVQKQGQWYPGQLIDFDSSGLHAHYYLYPCPSTPIYDGKTEYPFLSSTELSPNFFLSASNYGFTLRTDNLVDSLSLDLDGQIIQKFAAQATNSIVLQTQIGSHQVEIRQNQSWPLCFRYTRN